MSEQVTPLNQVGEIGLIRLIQDTVTLHQPTTVLGIGDDAAIIAPPAEHEVVVSTDLLVEGVHFDLTFCPLKHLGYKAVAVNVSDIAAMNALPTQITVSIALPSRFSVEAVQEFYEGVRLASEAYRVDVIGGDTTSSRAGLMISVTALGTAPRGKAVRRSGAQVNDLICVTGDLGGAYLGLQILEREKQAYLADPETQPNLAPYDYVVQRQLRPEARMDVVHMLRDLEVTPTSMIDVSDGLASEIMHLCAASGVGATIFSDRLPADQQVYNVADEFRLDPVMCILNGGEDYELLFTVPLTDFDKLKNHPDVTIIGKITEASDGAILATKGGNAVPLRAQGWSHFGKQ